MKEQKRVPALRFAEFSGEWEEKKLEDVSKFYDGKRKPIKKSDRAKMQGQYPYYGASGVIDYVNDFIFDDEIVLLGEDGENILSRNLPLAFRVSGKCWVNNHAHVIKPKKHCDVDFLALTLENVNYQKYNTGTAQPKLNQEVCSKIKCFYPSFSEQQKIASFLSAVDKKITQLQQKKALLEAYKKGVMQQIFPSAGSGQVPQLRFAREDGSAYPDWEEKKFKEIYSFYSTNSFSRDKLNYESGKVRNVHYGDIHTKFSTLFDINDELVPYINKEVDLSKIKKDSYLKLGDLLIADASEDYNDIGKTIEVVNLNNEKVISGLHTFHARPNKHKMALGFSGYLLQSWMIRKQVMKIAQGTKVLGISTGRLAEIKFFIPSYAEQTQIAHFLSAIDKKIAVVQTQIAQSQRFKKGLLQQMFV